MASRLTASRPITPHYLIPRYATLCAVAALAVGLAGCAATSEPARTAERTAAATRAPETNAGDALARIAQKSLEAGDPASAVSMLKRAHEMSPDSASILTELGRTLAALKAWQESAQAYAKAADLSPNDPAIRRGHAGALLALDLPTLAEQEYRAALALHEDAPTLSGLGVTLDLQNRHEEALAAFRRAVELDPNGTATRTNLGLSLALWGSSNEAIGFLAPMAASSTADARQRQNLALAFGLAGDLDQARAISKIDLGEEAVRNNLAYYETLRGLTPVLRMRALMGTHTPTVASNGTATVASDSTAAPAVTPVDATPPDVAPVKPSRAAENAPEKKTPTKTAKVATTKSTKSPAPPAPGVTSEVAVRAPAPSPDSAKPTDASPTPGGTADNELARDLAAEAAAMSEPKPEESKVEAAVPSTASSANDAAAAEPEIATAPKAESQTSDVANVRIAPGEAVSSEASSPADNAGIAGATPEIAPNAPEQVQTEAPVEPPASMTGATASAKPAAEEPKTSATSVAPATDATAAVEPATAKPEALTMPAASATDAFEGATYGAATVSTPSIPPQETSVPAEALPQVSVRVDGISVANVPQRTVIEKAAPEVIETKDAKAESMPVADGEVMDGSPPISEPIKRDGPTRLLPREHAAADPAL